MSWLLFQFKSNFKHFGRTKTACDTHVFLCKPNNWSRNEAICSLYSTVKVYFGRNWNIWHMWIDPAEQSGFPGLWMALAYLSKSEKGLYPFCSFVPSPRGPPDKQHLTPPCSKNITSALLLPTSTTAASDTNCWGRAARAGWAPSTQHCSLWGPQK